MAINEFQKPFSEKGYLNAEIITRKAYCSDQLRDRCECDFCRIERDKLKRRVNKLMGRKFYEVTDD